MEKVWGNYLTANDYQVIKKGGYGKRRGLGTNPLLVVIDVQYNYAGADKPIIEQIDEWPSGGGKNAWRAIRKIIELKEVAKENNVPVLYTRNIQKNTAFDSFAEKANRDHSRYLDGREEAEIVEELKPDQGDIVIDKNYASAFFGTPLISYLIKLKVDSLILVGGSTSGCIRATAVDAVTRNFNVAVVEDCVFDRIEVSHKASLLDLWMKYCDVIKSKEIINYFSIYEDK